ncbi:MAG TPA: hypothetical protein VHB21_14220 [Minicystis sp.]|nr:hypothetical protein [Minicystis sp.]
MVRARFLPMLAAVIVASAALALGTQSCGPTESTTSGTGGALASSITIVSPTCNCPRGGGCVACVALPPGPDPTIPILLDVENFDLRPPGVCGESISPVTAVSVGTGGTNAFVGTGGTGGTSGFANPCGHLLLTVDGVENNQGAGSEIDVLLGKLGDPVGVHEVELQVVREARNVFDLVDAEAPIVDRITLDTRPSCRQTCEHGAGGAGAGGGTGGTAGTTSGGLGGTTGTSGAGTSGT